MMACCREERQSKKNEMVAVRKVYVPLSFHLSPPLTVAEIKKKNFFLKQQQKWRGGVQCIGKRDVSRVNVGD